MINVLQLCSAFLRADATPAARQCSLNTIEEYIKNPKLREQILSQKTILRKILPLTQDESEDVAKDALICLINLTDELEGTKAVWECNDLPEFELIKFGVVNILNETCPVADEWTMLLNNLSHYEFIVDDIVQRMQQAVPQSLEILVNAFTRKEFNQRGANLNFLGPIFCNITVCNVGRQFFSDHNNGVIQRLLNFVQHENIVRRRAVMSILRNVCFDTGNHSWLLSDDVDILPALLLPLAGPESFDDEDNEKFPTELQYLDEDKQREPIPELRRLLLEALIQLCVTKAGRIYLRQKGAYEIMREYHKWESKNCETTLKICENLVDVLIRTEDEIGYDNLKDVDIPDDAIEKIEQMNKE